MGLAQTVGASVDAGGSSLRYADTVSTGAVAITPHVTVDWLSGFVDATGTYSQFTSGGWSTQGALSASRFIPAGTRSVVELAGLAGGSTHSDGTRTGEGLLNARLHFGSASREVFFGGGAGSAWDGIAWRTLFLGEAGASLAIGGGGVVLTVSPAMVNDSLRYADTQASLYWKRDRLDLGAVLGFRSGDQVTTTSASAKSWASATAVAWMTPRFAVVASGGSYPIDPTQGFPGGRFVALALRIATHGPGPQTVIPVSTREDALPAAPPAAATGFSAERKTSGSMTLRIATRGARSVEIMGDFTNWVPLPLMLESGTVQSWAVTVPVSSGKYQLNVRINGGPWIGPPGLLSMLDEFGGSVGLLVVK